MTAHARRSIHLIDIENLVGSEGVFAYSIGAVMKHYALRLGISPTDHFVVAASTKHTAVECFTAMPGARILFRHGRDGADLCLLDVMEENLASRYSRVCLASGDGIFARSVRRLRDEGAHTVVVSQNNSLSTKLGIVASELVIDDWAQFQMRTARIVTSATGEMTLAA